MNESKPNDDIERLLSEAEPYRTPTAVPEGPRRSSPMGWLAVLGILLGTGVAFAYVNIATQESASEHVWEFGYDSRVEIEAVPDNKWDRGGQPE